MGIGLKTNQRAEPAIHNRQEEQNDYNVIYRIIPELRIGDSHSGETTNQKSKN